ncbi:MAG: acyl-ACP--UDP-N-acetylglucosamine O-acyltransferase [Candidatus Sericytochromatia bacterium]|nr:acyl-ACP--UDP-N-acetylglucosamine O-acyltransferase [Candidatus Sericytochromatia bacterium]
MIELHPTAVVHPSARLADGVVVGPYAVIGEDVQIGARTTVGPHVVIEPHTTLGDDCRIFPGAVLGAVPQDLKFDGERTRCIIGDRNTIRECVTINRGTAASGETRVGHDNLLMAYVHVAHDCVVGNGIVLANAATLAGHVTVGDGAVVGGLVGVHQFCRIGALAMIGAMSRIVQDVPPYALAEGSPPRVSGTNVIGLRRAGVAAEVRTALKEAYRILYRQRLNVGQAVAAIEAEPALMEQAEVRHLVAFVKGGTRGLVGIARRQGPAEVEG